MELFPSRRVVYQEINGRVTEQRTHLSEKINIEGIEQPIHPLVGNIRGRKLRTLPLEVINETRRGMEHCILPSVGRWYRSFPLEEHTIPRMEHRAFSLEDGAEGGGALLYSLKGYQYRGDGVARFSHGGHSGDGASPPSLERNRPRWVRAVCSPLGGYNEDGAANVSFGGNKTRAARPARFPLAGNQNSEEGALCFLLGRQYHDREGTSCPPFRGRHQRYGELHPLLGGINHLREGASRSQAPHKLKSGASIPPKDWRELTYHPLQVGDSFLRVAQPRSPLRNGWR